MSVISYLRRVRISTIHLREAVASTVREDVLGQYFPVKPIVVQFPINDICNSRCVMCDIWRQDRGYEISPEDLRRVLANPFFAAVRYVGMNGGEPTLRRDLSEIGRVLIGTLPRLEGFGIITNAVAGTACLERSLELAEVARRGEIGFSVTVSLDGLDDDHDRNRGKTGNFRSAMKVIEGLQRAKVPVGVGCTLTHENCYGADDLLSWCETADLQYWEFRLGVKIKRLYNDEFKGPDDFSEQERFHLVKFFEKLADHPMVDIGHRRFYRSLVGQMAFGLPRSAGCDWRARGVTLDSRGDLSFCSVESPILGSALTGDPGELYRTSLPIRRQIIADKCASCEHDLSGPPQVRVAAKEFARTISSPLSQRLETWSRTTRKIGAQPASRPAKNAHPSGWKHVMITGWYGTETAGDKAILAEIIDFVLKYSPGCEFTITSLDRIVSEQTNREIAGLAHARIVELRAAAAPGLIESCDAVIFGGGPLEEIDVLIRMLEIFREANRQSKPRIMFGCGVGPLYTERTKSIVGGLLALSSAGFLRDDQSLKLARELGGAPQLQSACDPSLGFLTRWRKQHAAEQRRVGSKELVGLLRANTHEYLDGIDALEIDASNGHHASQFAQVFDQAAQSIGTNTTLLPMHSLAVGGDDRIFNRTIRQFMEAKDACQVERRYLTLHELLLALDAADITLAMRYHGHLFSLALGIPFISIDYTGKSGKVSSLIERLGYRDWCEPWEDLDVGRCVGRLGELLAGREAMRPLMLEQAEQMADQLAATYERVFQ